MTATGSPKPALSRKSLAGQALFVVALLLIACFLWKRTQPERLTTLSATNIVISGESLYMLGYPSLIGTANLAGQHDQSNEVANIYVQSIHDPAKRPLVQEDPRYAFCQPYALSAVDGNLYYAIQLRSSPSPVTAVGSPFGPPSATRQLGTFLLSSEGVSAPPLAGQTRSRYEGRQVKAEEVRFRQVSLHGGAPRDAAILRGAEFHLIDSHVFWIQPRQEESVRVIQGQTEWVETTAHSDLMLTSLMDGTTRCIRHGVSPWTSLSERGSGITWMEWAPFPREPALFYARALDGIVHPLKTAQEKTPTLLLDFGNRLYWTAGGVLMSSNGDGSDLREVLTPSDARYVFRGSLYSYRGDLYCLMDQFARTSNQHLRSVLCRLHPGQSGPIEIVRKLPKEAGSPPLFAGGYLYCVLQEQHRSLWATLTSDDAAEAGAGFSSTLCRFPLNP